MYNQLGKWDFNQLGKWSPKATNLYTTVPWISVKFPLRLDQSPLELSIAITKFHLATVAVLNVTRYLATDAA